MHIISLRRVWCLYFNAMVVGCLTVSTASTSGMVASSGSWHPNGRFAYNRFVHETSELSVLNVLDNPATLLFRTNLHEVVKAPICTADAVFVVSTEGTIRKFLNSGKLEFSERLPEVRGVCGLAGKLSDKCIYVTETDFKNGRPIYFLHLFDVGGNHVKPISKYSMRSLGPIVQFRKYLFVLGAKGSSGVKVQRIKLPKGLGWFN